MNEIVEIYMLHPIAQTVGIVAFVVALIGYISPNDLIIKILGGISLIIWSIHYILLGLYSGSIVSFIGSIRNVYAIKKPKDKRIMYIFFLIYSIGFYFTYISWFSFFTIASAFCYLYGFFNFEGIKLRKIMIVGNVFSMAYAFFGGSVGMFIASIIFTVGTILSIVKLKSPNGFIARFFDGRLFAFVKIKK